MPETQSHFLKEAARGLMKSANSSGYNGRPGRVPLCNQNGFDMSPLVITDAVA